MIKKKIKNAIKPTSNLTRHINEQNLLLSNLFIFVLHTGHFFSGMYKSILFLILLHNIISRI